MKFCFLEILYVRTPQLLQVIYQGLQKKVNTNLWIKWTWYETTQKQIRFRHAHFWGKIVGRDNIGQHEYGAFDV